MKYTLAVLVFLSVVACIGCKCGDPASRQSSVPVTGEGADTTVSLSTPIPTAKGDPFAYKKAKRTDVVRFETTNGEILVDVFRELAPKGADRFLTLVNAGFYNGVAFHQAKGGFAVRAGISPNPLVNSRWRNRPLPADPPLQQSNVGWLALQTTIPGSPSTEFVISLRDNANSKAAGEAPFGRVRDMQVVDRIAFEYENFGTPDPKRIQNEGYTYLQKEFPKLDYIKTARVITE